jgi:hypothetical protein
VCGRDEAPHCASPSRLSKAYVEYCKSGLTACLGIFSCEVGEASSCASKARNFPKMWLFISADNSKLGGKRQRFREKGANASKNLITFFYTV